MNPESMAWFRAGWVRSLERFDGRAGAQFCGWSQRYFRMLKAKNRCHGEATNEDLARWKSESEKRGRKEESWLPKIRRKPKAKKAGRVRAVSLIADRVSVPSLAPLVADNSAVAAVAAVAAVVKLSRCCCCGDVGDWKHFLDEYDTTAFICDECNQHPDRFRTNDVGGSQWDFGAGAFNEMEALGWRESNAVDDAIGLLEDGS